MSGGLAGLRGLRSAPGDLSVPARAELLAELGPLLERCDWFTVGVMAPSVLHALICLRQLEMALGWPALQLDPACGALEANDGPVFLKGNQTTGHFLVRCEAGLGEGLLITGHKPGSPAAEDTWGPLPLDFFGP